MAEEQVMVIPTSRLSGIDELPGIAITKKSINTFFKTCMPFAYFRPRSEAEVDETTVQIIPYIVIQKDKKYLVYKRARSGGENRLYDNYSIGLGGHINMSDLYTAVSNPASPISGYKCCQELAFAAAMHRELKEEVLLEWPEEVSLKPELLIYDCSNQVGRVHLGVVMFLPTIEPINISKTEHSIIETSWRTKQEIQELRSSMENWSLLCVDFL